MGYVVWVDGKKSEAFYVDTDDLETAHAELAAKYGCIDEADYAQENGIDGFPFNSVSSFGQADYYGVGGVWPAQ